MRADRLVSLVLLLRQGGRLTADQLAAELEVSTRTVLRDVEALSTAGVPVYAERGRHGGFALLPGFRTELTGLTDEEALALLTTGGFGLGPALSSAMRKVVDALPDGQRASAAARRFLVEPETDLLSRRTAGDEPAAEVLTEVRRAVAAGRRVRIRYAPPDAAPAWRTVDPIGLVTVRGRGYLVATRDGESRTYRLSRVHAAEALAEPAEPADEDLDRLWRERAERFRAGGDLLVADLRLRPERRDELLDTALAVRDERAEGGWLRLRATFQDLRHAHWALWQLGRAAEALGPETLRDSLRDRAAELATLYAAPVTPKAEPDRYGS